MSNTSLLAITARAKDEVSGPLAEVTKKFEEADKALTEANKKIVVSEKEKRAAMKAAQEAMKVAREQAANLKLALSGLSGAFEVMGKSAGLSAKEIVVGLAAYDAIKTVAVGAFKAISGAITDTVKVSADFQYALAEVSTLVDTAKVPVGELGVYVSELAGQYGQAPVTEVKALYQAISAGAFKANEAMSLMTTANRLAVAGVTDVFTAVDGLTNAINAFGGSMLEAETVANAFFIAMRDGKTTIGQFSSAIGGVASTARAVGVSLDETAAAIATITTRGINTDEAVTALNQAFTALIKPAKQAGEEARRLGIDFSAAGMAAAGGFLPFLLSITKNEKLTSQSIGKLFGNIRGIRAVLNLANDDGQRFAEILADMGSKSGAVSVGLDKISKTVTFQIKRFEALKDTIAVTFGDVLTKSPQVAGAIEGVNDAMTAILHETLRWNVAIGGNQEEIRKLVRGSIASALESFADLLETVAKTTEGFGRWSTALRRVYGYINAVIGAPLAPVIDATKRALSLLDDALPQADDSSGIKEVANAARKAAAAIREARNETAVLRETDEAAKAAQEAAIKRQIELQRRLEETEQDAHTRGKKRLSAEDQSYREWVGRTREKISEAAREDAAAERRASQALRRAEQEIKNDERRARERAQREAREMQRIEDERQRQVQAASEYLGGSLAQAFDQALLHAQNFGDAVSSILEDLALKAASGALAKIFGAGLGALKTASGGGALSSVLDFFGFARGGVVGETKPQRFASGGIARGPAGTDRIAAFVSGSSGLAPARLGNGEGVLPAELTAALRQTLGVPQVALSGAPSGGGMTIVLPPMESRGPPPDSAQITRYLRGSMLPALRQLHASGQLDFMRSR